jgi:hypothetical protein
MDQIRRNISYFLVLFGGVLAIYEQSLEASNHYILIAGLAMLMIGIYSISKRVSSKNNKEDQKPSNDESL